MSEFKNCPHCAAVDPVRIAYSSEEDNYDKANDDFMCVVCDVNKGGCGAASGYRATELEAVDSWNARALSHKEAVGESVDSRKCEYCGGIDRQQKDGVLIRCCYAAYTMD